MDDTGKNSAADRGKLSGPDARHSECADPAPPAPPATAPRAGESETLWRVRSISAEPIINAFHRRVVEILFVAYGAVLVYMSFVPFDFTRAPLPWNDGGLVWGLAVTPISLRDILANIGFYVPLGMLSFAVGRRRRLGRLWSFLLAALTAGAMSLLVEYGQHWVASRVSTWVDVTSNVLGGGLGALLVILAEPQIRRMAADARSAARRNWPLAMAKAAVCILLLVQLRPYDVTVDLFHAAASLRHADPNPLSGWNNLPTLTARQVFEGRRDGMNELPRAQWEYGLDRLADTAAYATITVLLLLGLSSQFARRAALYLWSGFVVTSLAGLVTGIRVFLISHGLDTSQVVCGLLGWLIGSVIVVCLLRATRAARTDHRTGPEPAERASTRSVLSEGCRITAPIGWRRAALASLLAFLVLYELAPFDFGTGSGMATPAYARRVCLLPFEAHFHARPNDAFYDLSGELLRYGLMGACLALVVQHSTRLSWRRQLAGVVAATGLSAVVLEGVHLVMASRQTDTTTVLLATVGAFAGAVTVRWARDYQASLGSLVTDDLLTRQLIEGDSYRPLRSSARESIRRNQDSVQQ